MKLNNKRFLMSILVVGLILTIATPSMIRANELEETKENEIFNEEEIENESNENIEDDEEAKVNEESEVTVQPEDEELNYKDKNTRTITTYALTDPAFPISSKPLHDAILDTYPSIDGIDGSTADGTISVAEANAYVGNIIIQNQSLGGTLTGIENFTSATQLLLNGNKFEGTIPVGIGSITNLGLLYLHNNQLSGEIPSDLGNLTKLRRLYLNTNQLEGSIPSSLGNIGVTTLTEINLSNNKLTGVVPSSLSQLTKLTSFSIVNNKLEGTIPTLPSTVVSFQYHYNNIESSDLSGHSFTGLGITKAINADLTVATTLYVTGSKQYADPLVRLKGNAGAFSWDSTTKYYVINPSMGATYAVGLPYIDEAGNLQLITSNYYDLSEGGLMDNEGNLILGADVSDVVNGNVVLPDGGTVITGEATYTFEGNTVVGETTIATDGKVIIEKNTTDGTTVTPEEIKSEITIPNGSDISIDLNGSGSTLHIPSGSVVTNNDGDETYLLEDGATDSEGNVSSSGTIITVSSDKANQVTTDTEGNISFPEGSIIADENGTRITYPGSIVFNPEDGSLKYMPIDNFFDENGNIKSGLTQEQLDEAHNIINQLPESDLKDRLKEKLENADSQFVEREAEAGVGDLFDENGNIKDGLTQNEIDNAQDAVNKLPAGNKKDELQELVDEAQKQFDEKTFVVLKGFEIFTGNGTVSTKIDAPVEKFSAVYVNGKVLALSDYVVTSGSTVVTLNETYLKTLVDGTYTVDIEFISGAKVSTTLTVALPQILQPPVDPSKPILPEVPTSKPSTKPSVVGGDQASGKTVNTGDTTNLMTIYMMLGVSLLGIGLVIKRRKEVK